MYEAFYGFREKPFSLLPDPDYLYFSDQHSMAFSLLEYGLLNQASFCVITGEIGAGKTTLIRHLLNRLDEKIAVGLVSSTSNSFNDMMSWILLAFGLGGGRKDKVEMQKHFIDFLIEQYASGHRVVLIIDEAQNMGYESLEELRMLSNVNADKDLLLQIIMVGQPDLRDQLREPALQQFSQRIAVDYHLEALNGDETREYIRHRLGVAGGRGELFDDGACDVVFRYSGGIPRLINLLCDTALVYAYAEQRCTIDATLASEVANEKLIGGIPPIPNKANNNEGATKKRSIMLVEGTTVDRKVE